jgi:hypothetical protein
MKRKKINKKLAVNKQTVSNLDADELRNVHGGTRTFIAGGPPSCISDTNFTACYTRHTMCGYTCAQMASCVTC